MHNYVHVCICLFTYQSYVICIFNQYGTRSNITDLRSPVSYQAMNNSTYVYLTCWVFLPFRMVNNSTYVQYTIDGDIDLTCISIYRMYLIWRGFSQAFLTNNQSPCVFGGDRTCYCPEWQYGSKLRSPVLGRWNTTNCPNAWVFGCSILHYLFWTVIDRFDWTQSSRRLPSLTRTVFAAVWPINSRCFLCKIYRSIWIHLMPEKAPIMG